MPKKVKSSLLLKRLGETRSRTGEPASLHFGGVSSELTAQPRNVKMWFYEDAPLRYMHHRFTMAVCLRGRCPLTIDASSYVLNPDEGILTFPFQAHFLTPSEKSRFLNLAVTFAVDNTQDRSLEPLRGSVFALTRKDAAILDEMLAVGRDESGRHKAEAVHLLTRFLCRKLTELRLARESATPSDMVESKYDRIVRHIHEHIDEPMTIRDIAAAEHLSVAHVRRIFKAHTGGINIGQFIKSVQIKRAYEMLQHTELGIAEIAQKCGFADSFVFSRAFKRMVGVSPTQYRLSGRR